MFYFIVQALRKSLVTVCVTPLGRHVFGFLLRMRGIMPRKKAKRMFTQWRKNEPYRDSFFLIITPTHSDKSEVLYPGGVATPPDPPVYRFAT